MALGAVAVAPPALAPFGYAPPAATVPLEDRLTLGAWSSENLTVTPDCPACERTVAPGTVLNETIRAVPYCAVYGCSDPVRNLTVSSPFTFVSSSPSLPFPIPAGGANLTVVVRAPPRAGAYTLGGSLQAPGPPGPVRVVAQDWEPVNASGGNGQFRVGEAPAPYLEAPGAIFNDTLYLNNSSPNYERVDNLTVTAPFTLVTAWPSFPYTVNPQNGTGRVVAELQAPERSGNYSVNGTLRIDLLPLLIVSKVIVNFTNASTPLTLVTVDIPTGILPGEECNGSIVVGNPSSVPHAFVYKALGGAFFFVNSTPNGTAVVPANGTLRYYLTISGPGSYGTYTIDLIFRTPF